MGAIVLAESLIIDQRTSDHCLPSGTITLLAARHTHIYWSSPEHIADMKIKTDTALPEIKNKYSCYKHAGDVT